MECASPVGAKEQLQHSDLQCLECANSVVAKEQHSDLQCVQCANPVVAKEQVQQ